MVRIGAGIALSVLSVAVDRAFDGSLIPRTLTGGPFAALQILGTVAGSMVSLTALGAHGGSLWSVVELAMGQFSPRIVATILQDKPGQLAIGIFVGTFAHAMLALSQVSTVEGAEFVPGVAIIVAFVLIIVSIMVPVLYVNHIGRKLKAASLIEAVSDRQSGKADELILNIWRRETNLPTCSSPLVRVHRSTSTTHASSTSRAKLTSSPSCYPRSVTSFRPATRCYALRASPRFDIASDALRRISLDTERSSTRTLPMVPGCWSISACAHSASRSIRSSPCRPSIASTTFCAIW